LQRKQETKEYLNDLIEKSSPGSGTHKNMGFEIDQLIVNSVISKPGNDFFYYFTLDFEWPVHEGTFIVTVTERPFRTTTTQIIITVNDLEVFNSFLQPRSSYLEDLADEAQAITANYISNYQRIMRELEDEDRSGTGIY
jgi:curli production assembly/transport component CsgE